MKKSSVLSDISSSKMVARRWKMMKTVLITFFNIMGIVHFEFISQGQPVNQAYYVVILKRLYEAVHRKQHKLWPSD